MGVVLCAALCAGALSACDGGPDPLVTETPSISATPSSSSPSPSSTVTAEADLLAQLPAEAKAEDLDGAIATAEFFVELYGTMLQTGDTALWDALSEEGCEFCQDGSDTAASLHKQRTNVAGGDVTVDVRSTRANVAGDGFTYVGVVAQQDAITETAQDASAIETSPQLVSGLILKVRFDGEKWVVSGVDKVEPGEIS